MKTTLELPDDLMRRVKLRALQRNQKLKEAVAQLIEAGMDESAQPQQPGSAPPIPVRLRGCRVLTVADIESAIAADRD
jgi:hypothetical protein